MTDQEDPERLYALGMFYMLGAGRPKDPGAGCLGQAADRGSLAAKRDLGIAYLNGLDVERCRNQRPSSSWPDPQCEKLRRFQGISGGTGHPTPYDPGDAPHPSPAKYKNPHNKESRGL